MTSAWTPLKQPASGGVPISEVAQPPPSLSLLAPFRPAVASSRPSGLSPINASVRRTSTSRRRTADNAVVVRIPVPPRTRHVARRRDLVLTAGGVTLVKRTSLGRGPTRPQPAGHAQGAHRQSESRHHHQHRPRHPACHLIAPLIALSQSVGDRVATAAHRELWSPHTRGVAKGRRPRGGRWHWLRRLAPVPAADDLTQLFVLNV